MIEAPDYLDDVAKAEWRIIVPHLERIGLLDADATALAMYCGAYSRWVKAETHCQKLGDIVHSQDKSWQYNPYYAARNNAFEQMRKMLAEFGLTPAARQRLSIENDDVQDAEWFKGRLWTESA